MRRSIAPLAHRNFALYWIGFAASNAGRHVEITGAVWLAYELTGSALLLGLLGLARAVPSIVLSPIAGIVADRVDQRRLLFVTQGLSLALSLALGILVVLGVVEMWHLYLQVALQACVTAFDAVARQSFFPRLVPRTQLPEAVTLSLTAAKVAMLVGPALGGVAIAAFGEAAPFLISAATFLVLMVAVVRMRAVPDLPPAAPASMGADLMDGLRHLWRSPLLSGLLKLEVAFSLLQMNAVMIAIVGREVLHVGPEGLGLLLSAPAVGGVLGIGALFMLGQTERQGRVILASNLAYALTLAAFAFSGDFVVAFVVLALTGLFDVYTTVARHSIAQLVAPPHLRGRVMANIGVVTRGLGPLAQTQSGVMAGAIGGPAAVLVAALGVGLATAWTAWTNRALWRFRQGEGEPEIAAVDA